jgi:hypothetical protein
MSFLFLSYWGLNTGPHACQVGLLLLDPLCLLFIVLHFFFFEIGCLELLAQAGLKPRSPELSLPLK